MLAPFLLALSGVVATRRRHAADGHTISEFEELFSITRSRVYRAVARDRARAST